MSSIAGLPNPALANTLAGIPSPSRYASGGPGPEPGTVNRLFFDAVEKYNRPNALMHKVNGAWESLSHQTVLQRVRRVALGLSKLGVRPGDRVALLSENRPEWAIVDYACICSSLTDVPIYPTLPAEQIPYLLNDSGARVLFVSTSAQAQKVASVRSQVAGAEWVIGIAATKADGCNYTMAEIEDMGAAADNAQAAATFKQNALAVSPDHVITLIYTSGTTGDPKGVMLTQNNIYSNAWGSRGVIPAADGDVALSFLPLSHIFERTGDYFIFSHGVPIAYAEGIDTVPLNMSEIKPSIMMSVPRLYEKIYARVLEGAVQGGALKARIFFWARAVGARWADVKLEGKEPTGLLAFQYNLAQKLVFSKLKERTGGRMRYFISGGAPLSPEINKFFYSAGLTIHEGYGLTETSPVISGNTKDAFRIGTVGRPIPGVEVMIAADGEILTRGPHVMKGYYNKPEATAEAIDAAGWFKTGDIGELDDGFLRITDRKKDIIVTAGGKNIAPQPIETKVKLSKFVSQAVMIGDKRKFPIILVVPEWDTLDKWAESGNMGSKTRKEMLALPAVRAKLSAEVEAQMTGLAHFEKPKKIEYLEHDFSIERGELTPKLSVKRRVIEKSYKELIDALYAEPSEG
ncbi:MAG: long-chain fatty acid--CoA ligase [Phycisphaerae bacterium]|nr:long-chain fatty acid--CoA ligase [Gemmatimonadaceae bacterium]